MAKAQLMRYGIPFSCDRTRTRPRTQAHAYAHKRTRTHTSVRTSTQVQAHKHKHTSTSTQAQAYKHQHTSTSTRTHTHTRTLIVLVVRYHVTEPNVILIHFAVIFFQRHMHTHSYCAKSIFFFSIRTCTGQLSTRTQHIVIVLILPFFSLH